MNFAIVERPKPRAGRPAVANEWEVVIDECISALDGTDHAMQSDTYPDERTAHSAARRLSIAAKSRGKSLRKTFVDAGDGVAILFWFANRKSE